MNKTELVGEVADRTGLPRADVARVVDQAAESIKVAVARGQRVALVGFGSFERQSRRPRLGRNPHTGDPVRIPARRVPVFKPGTEFRNLVAAGRPRKRAAAKGGTGRRSRSGPAR